MGRNERTYLGAADGANSPQAWFYMVHEGNRQLWAGYGSNGFWTTASLVEGTKYSFDATLVAGEQSLSIDGELVASRTYEDEVDARFNLRLFGALGKFESAARCYGLTLWQGYGVARSFKPCVVDGKAMLYDEVTGHVFKPSPDIAAGGNAEPDLTGPATPAYWLEYVESDGNEYVDTGVIGRTGTACEMDMAFLVPEDAGFLDSRTDNNRFYLLHNGISGALVGYGDWMYLPASGTEGTTNGLCETSYRTNKGDELEFEKGRKYHVVSSLTNNVQFVDVDGTRRLEMSRDEYVNTGCNLYLFACNQDGTAKWPGKGMIYRLRIWQDGVLVRNFRPVRLSNGVAVLWDTVHRRAYTALDVATGDPTFFAGSCGEEIEMKRGLIVVVQ